MTIFPKSGLAHARAGGENRYPILRFLPTPTVKECQVPSPAAVVSKAKLLVEALQELPVRSRDFRDEVEGRLIKSIELVNELKKELDEAKKCSEEQAKALVKKKPKLLPSGADLTKDVQRQLVDHCKEQYEKQAEEMKKVIKRVAGFLATIEKKLLETVLKTKKEAEAAVLKTEKGANAAGAAIAEMKSALRALS